MAPLRKLRLSKLEHFAGDQPAKYSRTVIWTSSAPGQRLHPPPTPKELSNSGPLQMKCTTDSQLGFGEILF